MPRRKKEIDDASSLPETGYMDWDPVANRSVCHTVGPSETGNPAPAAATSKSDSSSVRAIRTPDHAVASSSSAPLELTFIQAADGTGGDASEPAAVDTVRGEYFDHLLGSYPSHSRIYGNPRSRLQVFAVMDFDETQQCLVPGSCVFVWIAALEFQDAFVVTTMCSCQPQRDSYLLKCIKSRTVRIPLSAAQHFRGHNPHCGCKHAHAVVQLAAFELDCKSDQYREWVDCLRGQFDVAPVPVLPTKTEVIATGLEHPRRGPLYAVWGEDGDIVGAYVDGDRRYRCLLCRRGTATYCSHVSGLIRATQLPEPERKDRASRPSVPMDNQGNYQSSAHSRARYQQVEPAIEGIILSRNVTTESDLLQAARACGCPQSVQTLNEDTRGVLYHITWRKKVTVRSVRCPCGVVSHFDGKERALVNVDNKALFTVEMMRDYLWSFRQCGASVNGYIAARIRSYEENCRSSWGGDEEERCIQSGIPAKFRQACLTWICLNPSNLSSFQCCDCSECGIGVDGTSLSINVSELKGFGKPWQTNIQTTSQALAHEERNFPFATVALRTLVNRFAQSRSKEQFAVTRGLLREDLDTMLDGLRFSQNPLLNLLYLFHHVEVPVKSGYGWVTKYHCNSDLADFMYSISAMVGPVHHVAPAWCLPALNTLLQVRILDQQQLQYLQWSAPVLHKLVLTVLTVHHAWPAALDGLLVCLIEKSQHLETKTAQAQEPLPYNQPEQTAFKQFIETGHFFPFFPVKFALPKYGEMEEEAVCEKVARGGKNLGAGVLAVFCLKHKVTVGFVLLKEHESPKIVMELLLTRFRHVPCVVYDNACRLYQYIANREPVLLRKMTVMSDAYHSKNHKACAETFNFAKQWLSHVKFFTPFGQEDVVTSVIYEIRFQRYVAVKKHFLFMNRVTFYFFFTDFCAAENMAQLRRQRLGAHRVNQREERALVALAAQDDLH